MPLEITTVIYALGILGLFILDRKAAKSSPAIWIAVIWTFIGASREVTQWFGGGGSKDAMGVYLEGSLLDRAIYIALIICSLVVLFGRGRQSGAFLRMNWPILAFFVYGAISVLWSDFPMVAFKRWTKAFGNVLMVLVVLTD